MCECVCVREREKVCVCKGEKLTDERLIQKSMREFDSYVK